MADERRCRFKVRPSAFFVNDSMWNAYVSRLEKERLLECLDSIIYPVLTLPPEITSEIFHHCIRNFARGPLRVASVYKAWRAVALTTPALWSQFWAPTSLKADRNLPNLLQCWLPRARSLPLTLKYIRLGQFSHDAILAILARHSSQWKSLDLNAHFQPIIFPVDSIRAPLSSLKNLKINVHRWPADSPTCITAFLDAPQLRDVHLAKLSLSQISLPWIQLSHLDLCGQSLAQILEILQQTLNLEGLNVYVDHWVSQSVTLSPCSMLHLHSLKISHDPQLKFLAYLTLPVLERFESTQMWASGGASVQSVVERSGCSLRVLHLVQPEFSAAYDCISNLPSLTKVTITDPSWSASELTRFFELIADSRTIDKARIFSRLKSLHFSTVRTILTVD
ncbi:hypothetical protein C8R44DRAFT_876636 [Mycena epipterygia]|nr:hypothetical protein C8R44DRAFT_876636 [Mycena epipterygia]